MSPGGSGWWTADPELPEPGLPVDYGFTVDSGDGPGDTVLPDPRSRRQPDGVHGRSRSFDPGEHRWADGAWTGRQLAGGVVYELHVGTFTEAGTFDAAIEKLDHLVDLGITHVELLPVNGVNGTHNWGYDGVLWYTVHEPYGGPAGYQRFVDACHAAGLAVVQDVVYNHLGPSGNYLPLFGPYLHTSGSANTWGDSVNLDGPDSAEVRRYVLDNQRMWFEDYHVDGLRLDAVHALVDTTAKHLLEEMAEQADVLSAHLGRPLTLIAESDLNDPKLITSREAGGYGLTAQWDDDFHHVLHVALTGETSGYYADFGAMSAIAKVVTQGFFHNGTFSSFRGRDHGRPVDLHRTPAFRFVGYLQDHDQIGNRAAGDRISDTLSPDQLAVAATIVFTSPLTPMVFMGEEWAASTPWQFFTSHPEPDLGEATAKGRLEEFARMGWDPDLVPNPQDPDTFRRSKLRWAELTDEPHARVLQTYRELARLRRELPELTDPRFTKVTATWDDEQRWLTIGRGDVVVLANLSDSDRVVPLPPAAPTEVSVLFGTDDAAALDPAGRTVTLPGPSAVVLGPSGSAVATAG
jgi:maltooligosyltrehalose trehalohydrolase